MLSNLALGITAIVLSAPSQSEFCFRVHRDSQEHVVEATYVGAETVERELASGAVQRPDVGTWRQVCESPELCVVRITWGTTLRADEVEQLGRLVKLSELEIGTAEISSEFVELPKFKWVLGHLKSLEQLAICKRDLKDEDLEFIEQLPKLTELRFNADNYLSSKNGPFVSDLCAEYLTRSTSLRSLAIYEARHLTSEFVTRLTAGLPLLTRLELSSYKVIDDDGLQSLAKHTAIRELSLPDLRLSDEQFKAFRGHATLEQLCLDGRQLSRSAVLEVLSSMPRLKHCDVGPNDHGLQATIDQLLKGK